MKFEVKYNVKENEGVVIAMLTVIGEEDSEYTRETTTVLYEDLKGAAAAKNEGLYSYLNLMYSGIVIPNKYIGVARCREGDEFDAEFGKRLARSIAINKYYNKRIKTMRKTLREINRFHANMIRNIGSVLSRDIISRDSFAEKFNYDNGGDYLKIKE